MEDQSVFAGQFQQGAGPEDMAKLMSEVDLRLEKQKALLIEINVTADSVSKLPESEKLQTLRKENTKISDELNALENRIRYAAVLRYMNEGVKNPDPRVEVIEKTELVPYQVNDAIKWCAENGRYDCLKLNTPAFERNQLAKPDPHFPNNIVPEVEIKRKK